MAAEIAAAALLGALIGSFLNVAIHRVPLGESLVSPGSHCPSCDTPVAPRDNIPVLSWVLLRGRCRRCSAPIARRYPIVEAITAALFAAVAVIHAHDTAMLVLGLVLVGFLVPIALIDLDHRIIPNRLTGPAAVLAIVLGTALDPGGELERVIAGAAAGGALLLPSLLHPSGMGMGDAKLVGVLGLYLGRGVAPAFLVAFAAGTAIGVAIMLRKGLSAGRKTTVPFGPFLALGGLVGALAGDELVRAYLDTF
jgi:leader peptidase (prepilin peptidase)/N-methyltransferase